MSTAANEGWTHTEWGPLGPADRDLLVMIRQAGLCGTATGLRAQRQSGNPLVRTVARSIEADYGNLDSQIRTVAAALGVPLPDRPSAEQQGWMTELAGRSGSKFDRMFAQRLRLTEGEVLPVITSVRAGTRNELIRSFAASAAELVNQHMDSLESTGLVDYSRLPEPPAATVPASAGAGGGSAAGAGAREQTTPVARATLVPPVEPPPGHDASTVIAALISIGALLVALGLVGATGRRRRPAASATQRHGACGRRHAAHRW